MQLNPEKIIQLATPPGRETYEGEWVYLTLYSQTGCSITLNVLFKDEEKGDVRRKVKEKSEFDS